MSADLVAVVSRAHGQARTRACAGVEPARLGLPARRFPRMKPCLDLQHMRDCLAQEVLDWSAHAFGLLNQVQDTPVTKQFSHIALLQGCASGLTITV